MATFFLILLIALAHAELEFVIEIFRHGHRSPYNGDPKYLFGAKWDIGPAELTSLGEKQHYLLGLKRRRQYIENEWFLPNSYEPGTIYAESTDTNRTQMSAHSHLLGMYPFEFRSKYKLQDEQNNTYFVTTPIPVHMRSTSDIFMNYELKDWPKADELVLKSEQLSDEEYTNFPFVQKLISQVNKKLNEMNYGSISYLINNL